MSYIWYKNNRVIVRSRDMSRAGLHSISKEYFDEYISPHKHYGGSLYLKGSKVDNLGSLETVGGYLNLRTPHISSLGNLRSVGKNLFVNGVELTSLGNLESVGGNIFCTEGSPTHELLMNSKFKGKINTTNLFINP